MRTRILRITATAGATALLATIGAVATAGSASAATAQKSTVVTAHYGCWWGSDPELPSDHPPVLLCAHHEGLLGNVLDDLLGDR